MTSFLRLNGIAVPVSVNTPPSLETEFIGKNTRALDGSLVSTRRAVKESWKFTTAIKTAAEALAFRDLVIGKGHVLSFDSSWYTSKGMAPVSLDGSWTLSSSSPKYGAGKALFDGGDQAVYAFFPSTSPWTLAWWFNPNAAGWNHYVQTSAGSKWIDGVLTPGGTMLGFDSVVSGSAGFGSTVVTNNNGIDDIVALPYVVPSDWPAQMFAFGAAFGLLPALTADGDAVEQNLGTISVLGSEPSGKLYRGATAKNLHDFTFELHQR